MTLQHPHLADLDLAAGSPQSFALRNGGVEVVLVVGEGLPEVIHWGAPLGDVDLQELRLASLRQISSSALDVAWPLTVQPHDSDGWEGRPGLVAHRGREIVSPRWHIDNLDASDSSLIVRASSAGITLIIEFELDESGVLRATHEVLNTADEDLEISSLEVTMPVGDAATEALDLSGRWTRERSPQRSPLLEGSRVRESRRGRTGHDSPTLLVLGSTGFDDGSGELWAAHLAWSADSVYRYDALPESQPLLGVGALLRAGEVVLPTGAGFRSPTAVFVWSNRGLDGMSDRLHESLRRRAHHPRSPRLVTLNTWEAVYFQHDLTRLREIARTASEIGVERFVLDDGWFVGRRDDSSGLGDWRVDSGVWPEGLHPLVKVVREHGMQFGMWFEPEMVNLDSELARAHPDWLLQDLGGNSRSWRNQYVLDVANPEVSGYLLESISALVAEYQLDYIKWDQNRDLLEAVHGGRAAVHRHTEAVYALLKAVRIRHPRLEIESCASGGARVDLGVLEHTDRVWASDTNDPVERLDIQRWTELLIPLELIGAHVGPPVAPTTRRETSLGLRIATALFGSFGIEWDITECTPEELDQLRDGISAYKRLRELLHRGRLSHLDASDEGMRVSAVVAADARQAVVRVARVASSGRALPRLLRIPGLDPAAYYEVRPLPELRLPPRIESSPVPWLDRGQLVLTGAALAAHGVRLPLLGPGQAVVLEVTLKEQQP